ncbi:glycine cleavage system protein GcvH [Chelatococcus reniformis]|uniref:Glycine cleavage system H protein n=1 Tax=Chelatococcus reniformis TaxID=1494448 RepID=A0A916U8S7_9HYPH|nr:glycine cleavage system protein GcvH [Chelatococcus reniformis]GGC62799.1 glycine cleavage system H protein [Chelatococcus reniformis]
MAETRYTKDHEYIHIEGDVGVVGISDYAQQQLGDIVFVELPEVGRAITQGAEAAVVESVKAASEIYAPVAGEVIEINAALEGEPGAVNEDPLGRGWFLKLRIGDPAQLASLMSESEYEDFLKTIA